MCTSKLEECGIAWLGKKGIHDQRKILAPAPILLLPRKLTIWNKVWSPDNLLMVNVFFWLLVHGRIPTMENLKKRGIQGPTWTILCRNSEETRKHLFLNCPFATQVWELA
jgi:hypothetical protein